MTKNDPKIDIHVAQATRSVLEELIARLILTSHPELSAAPPAGPWPATPGPVGRRLVLVSRAGLVCDCLRGSLAEQGFEVAFQPLHDVVTMRSIEADLVVFNLSNYGPQVATAVRERIDELRALLPHIPAMALIEQADGDATRDLVGFGITSVIVGVPSIKLVMAAIQLVILGGLLVSAEIRLRSDGDIERDGAVMMVPSAELADDDSAPVTSCCFTRREVALLAHLREGRQNKVIAHQLDISESTVKVHLRNIMRKLHASNRTQVVNILAGIQRSAMSHSSGLGIMPDIGQVAAATPLSKPPNTIAS